MEHDMCGPCDPKRACLKDLSSLARHERQQLYAEILRDSQRVLTPSQVKEELEWRGATFAFVGQDMAAMRQMPFVQFEGRGMYRWNSLFKVRSLLESLVCLIMNTGGFVRGVQQENRRT
jgi:hypothetical protein